MEEALRSDAIARPVGSRQVFAAVIASCLGWALDLFDLFVVLFVAPVVGRLFFPSTNSMLSLAAVYASFASLALRKRCAARPTSARPSASSERILSSL